MGTRAAILSFILALAFSFAGVPLHSQTKEIDARKEEIKRLEKDISFIDNQIQSVKKQQRNTLDELVLVQRKIANRKKLLKELDAQIKVQNGEIARTKNEMSLLDKRLDTLEHYYRRMVYNAYKHRDTKLWFMYILASNNEVF